jgi:hypothetical protein
MARLRRIALTVLVGVLVTLPTAGSALADNTELPHGSDQPTSSVILTASLGD